MTLNKKLILTLGALAMAGCGEKNPEASSAVEAADISAAPGNGAVLETIIAGEHRSAEERARDTFRHPKETLLFFGIEPQMSVVEIWPGGGWYTQILAPYLKDGGGTLFAAELSKIDASERVLSALAKFEKTYVDNSEVYGNIELTVLGAGGDIAPDGSVDAVLTFRNVHNWQGHGVAEEYFEEFYRALKPGGVLGVVDHRADGANLPNDGDSGYAFTDDVKALAAGAGFEFDRSSEINANPNDTKDHPFGVWTLPPSKRSSEIRGREDPEFDRTPYDAIGESDRMTLKFRKPAAADSALLE